jgi:hypothetical protein
MGCWCAAVDLDLEMEMDFSLVMLKMHIFSDGWARERAMGSFWGWFLGCWDVWGWIN